MTTNLTYLAITPGDPAGIGPEITLEALSDPQVILLFKQYNTIPIIYANLKILSKIAAKYFPNIQLLNINHPQEISSFNPYQLPTINITPEIPNFTPGIIDPNCGRSAYNAIIRACEDIKNNTIHKICTGPIHKLALRKANIDLIGHTEILAHALNANDPLTLFITNELRIFFYSRHLSLKDAISAIKTKPLAEFIITAEKSLQKIGFQKPKLALAALNPHASDSGQFGNEEADFITPAAIIARENGINISDPIGADSVFAMAKDGLYDAVISLYHDQGHIAAKTYDFHRTISATLQLPALRTSVDHGTAFDIAWKNKANALSMKTAITKALTNLR